ncbi:hypothetical protein PLESTB_001574700 [Pleodorina starrii]|uniref:DNA primase large subunit C-terminal domain-containing protein n=1 Tax=Pleodorina starrii TaxID=330485 RepID=A0A9W6BXI2_9CHLO|nr:hypothetical protein PLESTM_000880100 [Pleodorina starrii]GLC60107.1 hypothetical protein PLESTB_001574700 [Pleodorina starrii]GLC68993.1 hypothetical protein PLESTF_000767300 [Pleodorina starrii]
MQVITSSKGGLAGFTPVAELNATGNVPKNGDRMLTDLSMYTSPPSENITLEEFERLALARLSVLKEMEAYKLRHSTKGEKELLDKLNQLKQKHMKGVSTASTSSAAAAPAAAALGASSSSSREEEVRNDLISHYVLRLAYCRTAELRKWFVAQECDMFRLKFGTYNAAEHEAFLAAHAPQYRPVPAGELDEVMPEILQVMKSNLESKEAVARAALDKRFYKVSFTRVPELVSQRRVLLRGGWAYVSRDALAPLVVAEFRAGISKGLSDMARRWRQMFPAEEEQRLQPLVASLTNRSLLADYSGVSTKYGDVSAANLHQLAARHFPLCMNHLMGALHSERHLRHGGRQQLSLFLKAIGLPMEEALMFWRSEFAPRTPSDAFDKQYAYNIRHNYGREGKRTDYTAHNCTTIVGFSGGAGDHHGCPYRRLDEASLRAALGRMRCDERKIEEAVSKARDGHYQLACASAFEGVHRVPEMDVGISAPLQYYAESRRICAERDAAAAPAAGGTAEGADGSGAAASAGAGAAAGGEQQQQPQQPGGRGVKRPAGALPAQPPR